MPTTASMTVSATSEIAASTLTIARFAAAGKAANTSPSITNTSPIAIKKSDMAERHRLLGRAARSRAVALGSVDGLAARIHEVAEEIRVRVEQHAGVVVAQPV